MGDGADMAGAVKNMKPAQSYKVVRFVAQLHVFTKRHDVMHLKIDRIVYAPGVVSIKQAHTAKMQITLFDKLTCSLPAAGVTEFCLYCLIFTSFIVWAAFTQAMNTHAILADS